MSWYKLGQREKLEIVEPFRRSMPYGLSKKAQTGEWWIIDGQAVFADSDVGDMGHEAYVINAVQAQYAYSEFDKGEWIDWDGFKKKIAEEVYEETRGMKPPPQYFQKYPKEIDKLCLPKLKEMGMTDEEYMIAEGHGDARAYGMEHLGWKRVKGNNVQTQTLTVNDLKTIANGLWDVNNDLSENDITPFNIEVVSTGAFYTDVPYSLISDGSPSVLRQYQHVYAKKYGWYKYAQIWNVPTEGGIEEKVAALYELEYKYSMLRDRNFNGVPERRDNILQGLEGNLFSVLDDVKDILLRTFDKWLKNHALLDAETWAEQRAGETSIEDMGAENAYNSMIYEYVKYAINSGQYVSSITSQDYNKYFREILNKALRNILRNNLQLFYLKFLKLFK